MTAPPRTFDEAWLAELDAGRADAGDEALARFGWQLRGNVFPARIRLVNDTAHALELQAVMTGQVGEPPDTLVIAVIDAP